MIRRPSLVYLILITYTSKSSFTNQIFTIVYRVGRPCTVSFLMKALLCCESITKDCESTFTSDSVKILLTEGFFCI